MLIVIVKGIYNWYKIYLILVAYFGRYSIHESLRCDSGAPSNDTLLQVGRDTKGLASAGLPVNGH